MTQEVQDIYIEETEKELALDDCSTILQKDFRYNGANPSFPDSENRLFALFSIDELLQKTALHCSGDFAFYAGGWQSWGYGGELAEGEKLPPYTPLVPQWKHYIAFPGKTRKNSGLEGEFIIYLRWGKKYLVLASAANVSEEAPVPPVRFCVDRKKRKISCYVYSDGKEWKTDELVARLCIFSCSSYFALKDAISCIFGGLESSRFDYLRFLSAPDSNFRSGGWESWYNHYANINAKLIQEDLISLGKTENIIKLFFMDKKLPTVFQVDDGWEQALGDWDVLKERFPEGMTALAKSISSSGYIPGLWIAPFIVDWRSDFAKNHCDWILKDKKGKPIAAGMNFLWGAKWGKEQPSFPYSYFCLDLSRDDVLSYLDSLMEKVVNEWGFRYVKLDFLFAGMIYGSFANGGAAYEWYDRALKVVTSRKTNNHGERVAYLGCGLPLESSFTILPLSRIGPDTKEDWDTPLLAKINFPARPGAIVNMLSTLGHAFWNQSIFINDPDVIFMRYENISLSDTEKELVALVNYLFASQIMHSDDLLSFSEETDGAFTKKIFSLYKQLDGVEFGLENRGAKEFIIFSRDKQWCGIINLSEKPFTLTKKELLESLKKTEGTLVPLIEHCVSVDEIYTAESHSISIYQVKGISKNSF